MTSQQMKSIGHAIKMEKDFHKPNSVVQITPEEQKLAQQILDGVALSIANSLMLTGGKRIIFLRACEHPDYKDKPLIIHKKYQYD